MGNQRNENKMLGSSLHSRLFIIFFFIFGAPSRSVWDQGIRNNLNTYKIFNYNFSNFLEIDCHFLTFPILTPRHNFQFIKIYIYCKFDASSTYQGILTASIEFSGYFMLLPFLIFGNSTHDFQFWKFDVLLFWSFQISIIRNFCEK